MAERVYAKKSAEGQAAGETSSQKDSAEAEESVVDAEFEEVKDDKKE